MMIRKDDIMKWWRDTWRLTVWYILTVQTVPCECAQMKTVTKMSRSLLQGCLPTVTTARGRRWWSTTTMSPTSGGGQMQTHYTQPVAVLPQDLSQTWISILATMSLRWELLKSAKSWLKAIITKKKFHSLHFLKIYRKFYQMLVVQVEV